MPACIALSPLYQVLYTGLSSPLAGKTSFRQGAGRAQLGPPAVVFLIIADVWYVIIKIEQSIQSMSFTVRYSLHQKAAPILILTVFSELYEKRVGNLLRYPVITVTVCSRHEKLTLTCTIEIIGEQARFRTKIVYSVYWVIFDPHMSLIWIFSTPPEPPAKKNLCRCSLP